MGKKRKKKSAVGRFFLIFFGTFAALFLLSYLGIAYYFRSHYFPNTTIGSSDCSMKTPEYSISRTEAVVESYLLTIYDRDGNKFLLRGPDFSYQYVPDGEEERILESQNPFLWPQSLWTDSSYELDTSVSYDSSQAADALKKLECFSSEDFNIAPEDASLVLGDDGYEIIPETYGNTLIFDRVLQKVRDALDGQLTAIPLTDEDYLQPSILSDDPSIRYLTDQIDTFTNATITYDIGDAVEGLSSSDIYHMLVIDEDNQVTLDEDKIARYVQHLASTFNTYADRRSFATSMGDVIEIGGGDYGWVIDKKAEAAQLLEDLNGGVPVEREPVYEQTAKEYGPDDIGNTYVEVDYTNQHLWYYRDGELVLDSDFVSGNLSKGNGSPDGVFKIVYKKKDATLVGEDYESAVDYFMPFAYNVGFHDASWRSTFGGEIYRTKGSHGCINMPHDAAEELYNELEVGTPVIAFYREEIQLTSENARITNAFSYVDPATLAEETQEADDNTGTAATE
jgi:hypothetical protein